MIGERRQQELLLRDGRDAARRRGEEGAAGEKMGLLARMRQAATGGRERVQRELQHQDSIKRRELTYDEDAWARHGSADFGPIKLRHMQESEGTTQVSGDDYGELPAESEDEETGNAQVLEEEDEDEADDEKVGLYAYAYAELEKRLRGDRRAERQEGARGEEEEVGEEKLEDVFDAERTAPTKVQGREWYYGAHLTRQRRRGDARFTPVVEEEEGEEGEEDAVEEEEEGKAGEAAEGDEDALVEEPEEGEEEYEREEATTYTEEEEGEEATAVAPSAAGIKRRVAVEEGDEVSAYDDAWQGGQEEEEGHVEADFGGDEVAEADEADEGGGDEQGLEEEEASWAREAPEEEENVDEERYVEEEKAEAEYEVGGEEQVAEAGDEEEEEDGSSETLKKEDVTPYTLPQIEDRVEVRHVIGKGRCLYTRNELEPGAIIFVESPVFVATPSAHAELWQVLEQMNEEEAFELPPVWHLGALCSLTVLDEEKKAICLDKWIPEPNKAPSYDVLRVLERTGLPVHARLYERMLMVWRYNSFGHHSEQPGLVLYNRISMMAHSCSASACWHYGEGDSFILRARVKLNAGDELTISYIGDEDLFKSTDVRREKVSGWLFTCRCPRCSAPVDNARGFRCSTCATGSMFFKTEDGVTTSSPCTVCQAVPSDEIIKYYLEFEQAYVDRLAETDKTDLPDAKLVFFQAQRVFNQHWVLYQLHTILFEGHRDGGDYETAAFHQQERIKYVSQVMPLASYTLAWLHEELGDTVMTKEEQAKATTYTDHKLHVVSGCFEDAYNLLYILCGKDHEYTIAADAKKTSCDQKLAALSSATEN